MPHHHDNDTDKFDKTMNRFDRIFNLAFIPMLIVGLTIAVAMAIAAVLGVIWLANHAL